MKPYVLSLLCAALASLALAADAMPAPPVGIIPPAPPICAGPCPAKVCVSELTVRKTDKVVYDDRCVDYCLPHCSLASIFGGCGCGCGESGCLNCGHPRTRHVLIKKFVHEECPDTKCEVREQVPCGAEIAPAAPPLLPHGK